MKYKLLLVFYFVAILLNGSAGISQSLSFKKINTSTKADITQMLTDSYEKEIYFLANKLYRLSDSGAIKIELPTEGVLRSFYPVSANEIWLSFDLLSYNASLYRYVNGVMQNIYNPFSNTINYIFPLKSDKIFMVGLLETFLYHKEKFYKLPLPPWHAHFTKYFITDTSQIWLIDANNNLYQYSNSTYIKMLDGKSISDFSFQKNGKGMILANDELYAVKGNNFKRVYQNELLKDVLKIHWLNDNRLLMIGAKGLILSFANGKLSRHEIPYTETLRNIVTIGTEEIWISGENGLMLYSGPKKYTNFIEPQTAFVAHNLIAYSIPTNNEYGVAIADFDINNKLDIYTVRISEQNRFYLNFSEKENAKTNNFKDEVIKRNATGMNQSSDVSTSDLKLGISVADVDNDNDQDIYLCHLTGNNRLLLNKGNGFFRNVSSQSNRACANMNRSNAAAFADVDNDGDLDLFVTSENSSNRLYENDGTGHFTDVTVSSGLASSEAGMCASFADVNNDGLADLAVSFWHPGNKLYINKSRKGNIQFTDYTSSTDIVTASPAKSNAVVFADINNDGHNDLFIANRGEPNKLYINNGKGNLIDKTNQYFNAERYLTNGAVFADFDLDGYVDLYITNVGENVLYKNRNGLQFEDVTANYEAELNGYSTGSATGDIDNDGDPDLYVSNYLNGNSKLFQNNTGTKTFIKFKLKGVISNKDAVGAKIWLYKKIGNVKASQLVGFREINGGSGYASISAKEAIFGCDANAEYVAQIKFPSTADTIKVEQLFSGTTLEIPEITGSKAFAFNESKRILLFLKNSENHPEFFKMLLMASVLLIYNFLYTSRHHNIYKLRWFIGIMIYLVFMVLNGFYLFMWPLPDYFTPIIITLSLLIIMHLFVSKYSIQKHAALEKQQIRNKLSRDLHDDLASTLGSILIYASNYTQKDGPSNINLTKKIVSLSNNALQSISDIIWMTSPSNDTLQSLISKVNVMMYDIFEDNKIQFISTIQLTEKEVIMKETLRNNLFLILKEAAHNILKHAHAKEVNFDVQYIGNVCEIKLKDNGIGLTNGNIHQHSYGGNGIRNMLTRSKESEVIFQIYSGEIRGTEVFLKFEI